MLHTWFLDTEGRGPLQSKSEQAVWALRVPRQETDSQHPKRAWLKHQESCSDGSDQGAVLNLRLYLWWTWTKWYRRKVLGSHCWVPYLVPLLSPIPPSLDLGEKVQNWVATLILLCCDCIAVLSIVGGTHFCNPCPCEASFSLHSSGLVWPLFSASVFQARHFLSAQRPAARGTALPVSRGCLPCSWWLPGILNSSSSCDTGLNIAVKILSYLALFALPHCMRTWLQWVGELRWPGKH